MRCTISSRAGQVLAKGHLVLQKDENDEVRLCFRTDGGKLIQGGTIDPNGELVDASEVLFRQFFETWKTSGMTLAAAI